MIIVFEQLTVDQVIVICSIVLEKQTGRDQVEVSIFISIVGGLKIAVE